MESTRAPSDTEPRGVLLRYPDSGSTQDRKESQTCGRHVRPRRPILDPTHPAGFVAYPYYTVREVAEVFSISDDMVRALFRNARQGPVLQICDPKPGRRRYETLLVPHATLTAFMNRFTKETSRRESRRRLKRYA